jgi:hypothetical protein
MSLRAYSAIAKHPVRKQSPTNRLNLIKEKLPFNRGLLGRDFGNLHLDPPRNDMKRKEAL